jgi:hypothetical protein
MDIVGRLLCFKLEKIRPNNIYACLEIKAGLEG